MSEHVSVRLKVISVTPEESAKIEKQIRYQERKAKRLKAKGESSAN